MTSLTGCGHLICKRQSGYPTVCIYWSSTIAPGSVALAEAIAHRHRWVYDGVLPSGGLVYHCDAHDPPVTRIVFAPATVEGEG